MEKQLKMVYAVQGAYIKSADPGLRAILSSREIKGKTLPIISYELLSLVDPFQVQSLSNVDLNQC